MLNWSWSRVLAVAGPLAVLSVWITIFWAISRVPGYHFLGHSLSDLGGPTSPHPLIYNIGLMVTGLFIGLYGTALLLPSRDPGSAAGATLFTLDGVFLALIGYFHEGTSPHVFLSTWFFIDAALACFLWGIGHRFRPRWAFFYMAWAVTTFAGGMLLPFASTAYRELFGVGAIDVFGLVSFVQLHRLLLNPSHDGPWRTSPRDVSEQGTHAHNGDKFRLS